MYLLATHIPVYLTGSKKYLETDWLRDLVLTRDWMGERFGRVVVIAPRKPVETAPQKLEPVGENDGIEVIGSFDLRCRAREYWLRHRRRWIADVRKLLPEAAVVHAGMDDLYRPMQYLTHTLAVKAGRPTVFVGTDMDMDACLLPDIHEQPLRERVRRRVYLRMFDRCMRRGVRTADLALLKEGVVHDRYAPHAANARAFCHTMYDSGDVVGEAALERRLGSLIAGRGIRLVYCGRLVPRKGVHGSIRIVEAARRQGVEAELDVIGDGPQRGELEGLAAELGVGDRVRLLGSRPYGSALLADLAGYDALLFCPEAEDTPRMVYDAYAAGLPLLVHDIPFLRHRVEKDRAGVLIELGDVAMGARILKELDADRSRLADLARAARAAGLEHAADNWYRKRVEWTVEAVERHRAGRH